MSSSHRPTTTSTRRRSRSLLLTALILVGASACGSSDDSGATPVPDDVASDAADSSSESTGEASTGSSGDGLGIVVTTDGTSYEFVMSTCDTSENGGNVSDIEDAYDISGRTADQAFYAQFIRAGLDEESVVYAGAIEGDFDDEGKNSKMIYTYVSDTLVLTVDGGNVSGTATLKAIGPTRPHGDQTDVTIDVRC
jgi:hypothetical protein